jgi:hypothetical protein
MRRDVHCEACRAAIDPGDALCRACGRIRDVERRSIWPIGAVAALLVVMGGTFFFGVRKFASASKFQPKNDIISIHPIAEKWVYEHEGQCPTVDRLIAEKELSTTSRREDPWGSPYRITCDGTVVHVHCDGPDRTPDTADDLRYP